MRHTLLLGCLLVMTGSSGFAQEKDRTDKPTRKGDPLSVTGCLSGAALDATETSAPEASGLLAGGLTFRLTGNKALLKDLRDRHDRKVVRVRGVLKSDLPQPGGLLRGGGRVRITIGAASPSSGRPEAESRRVLPVLEVQSFDGSAQTSCGR